MPGARPLAAGVAHLGHPSEAATSALRAWSSASTNSSTSALVARLPPEITTVSSARLGRPDRDARSHDSAEGFGRGVTPSGYREPTMPRRPCGGCSGGRPRRILGRMRLAAVLQVATGLHLVAHTTTPLDVVLGEDRDGSLRGQLGHTRLAPSGSTIRTATRSSMPEVCQRPSPWFRQGIWQEKWSPRGESNS